MLSVIFRFCSALCLIFALSGCVLGPLYSRPDVGIPERFSDQPLSQESIANTVWWEFFKDPELQNHIRLAISENKDLQVAFYRIAESRAALGFVRADQFPRLDLTGNANRIDPSDAVKGFSGSPVNDFGAFGGLSFEVDLWGKLQQATEAQRMELLSTEYAYRTITIALVAQVARTYFILIDLDQRLQVAQRTVKSRRESTGLIRARFDSGIIPEIDVNQAMIEELDAMAQAAQLERDQRRAENALNLLLGRAGGTITRAPGLQKLDAATELPAGFPSALLERRPDIQAAEYSAKSAFARIGVAEAQRLPSLNLLGTIGLQSSDASEFFSDSVTWDYGGGILGPIIDFGKNRSRVEIAEARAQQEVQAYEKAVLVAVAEVEDAIAAYRTYKAEHQARSEQVNAASNAARLSRARYDQGVAAYLEVLDIERSLFTAELAVSQTYQRYLSAIVDLYQALGGGWETEVASTPTPAGP